MKISSIRKGFGNIFRPPEIVVDMDDGIHILVPVRIIEDSVNDDGIMLKRYLSSRYAYHIQERFMRCVDVDMDEFLIKVKEMEDKCV